MENIEKNIQEPNIADQAQAPSLEVGKILELGQVSLKLDTYDDIFSDFDPRPFSERTLSDDFLLESKKAFREKETGRLQLKFLIPEKERNLKSEGIIIKRLKEHFKKHYQLEKKEFDSIKRNSMLSLIIGFSLMLTSSFISLYESKKYIAYLLITIFEPTGWFLVWYGMDTIFYKMKEERLSLEFNQKMARTEIIFVQY
ncbi:hypothetical protein HZA55_08100 [Candidatus Poribacteria bacterium]|nr:hypothetical protein [Candidatus Poribacteria bacterium]